MSLIPHTFFPRSFFDMDTWLPSQNFHNFNSMTPFTSSSLLQPSMLDLFDPFDDVDRMMSRNLQWIDQPSGFMPRVESLLQQPAEPQRHRITIDCAGYKPESIKTELRDVNGQKQLCVWGFDERPGATADDYSKKEFKKNYMLPRNAQHDKLVSFMAPGGKFIVDVPLQTTGSNISNFLPQVIDLPENQGKGVQVQLQIPSNVDPNKVQVSVKDRDLIVKIEDKTETPDTVSRVHIYNRTRLPEGTDFEKLKCTHQNNMLNICAPLRSNMLGESSRPVPIEKSSEKQSVKDTK